jgi:hypothetical protein
MARFNLAQRLEYGNSKFMCVVDCIRIEGDQTNLCALPLGLSLKELQVEKPGKNTSSAWPHKYRAWRFGPAQFFACRDMIVLGFEVDYLNFHGLSRKYGRLLIQMLLEPAVNQIQRFAEVFRILPSGLRQPWFAPAAALNNLRNMLDQLSRVKPARDQ